MAFFHFSSPHSHNQGRTQNIMMEVILCTLPGVAALSYYFGLGVLFQIAICAITAVTAEALVALIRKRDPMSYLADNSALLTGLLLAISIPPLAPWWIGVIGTLFAIVIAKHLYGGLGQNPFNPAMVAYVVLLISFPVQMTSWLVPLSLIENGIQFKDFAYAIFTSFTSDGFSVHQLSHSIDGFSMATPLDAIKTGLASGETLSESINSPIFGMFFGKGWAVVNLLFLIGGLILIKRRVIQWHIPLSFLGSLFLLSFIGHAIDPDHYVSASMHLFSGATMFGAFFIATDPVSGSTTRLGRLVFGAMIGALVYLIRTFGGFPDGVAFAVLLANMCVPLIDQYTKPQVYGYQKERS